MGYMVCEKSMVDTNLAIRRAGGRAGAGDRGPGTGDKDKKNNITKQKKRKLFFFGNLIVPSWDSDSGL